MLRGAKPVPESEQRLGLFPGNYIKHAASEPLHQKDSKEKQEPENDEEYSDPRIDVSSYIEYAKQVFADKEQISIDEKFKTMIKSSQQTSGHSMNKLEEDRLKKHQQLSRFGVG